MSDLRLRGSPNRCGVLVPSLLRSRVTSLVCLMDDAGFIHGHVKIQDSERQSMARKGTARRIIRSNEYSRVVTARAEK